MGRRSKALAAVGCMAIAGAGGAQVIATTGSAAAGFNPKSLSGKWSGKWENTTFGSEGTIRATVRTPGTRFKPTIQFGGFVFGCEDPAPAIFSLTKGRGANKWNARGFKVSATTEAFGALTASYKHSTKRLTAQGKDVSCRPGLTWELTGKLTATRFTGTVQIDLGGGQRATAKLSAKKL